MHRDIKLRNIFVSVDELGKIYDTYRTDVESHKLNGTNSFQQILETDWFSNLHEYIQTQESPTCVLHCKQNVLSTISTHDHMQLSTHKIG